MMYPVNTITIRAEDRTVADEIIAKFISDIIDVRVSMQMAFGGVREATYWIKTYLYDDFVAIRDAFILKGLL